MLDREKAWVFSFIKTEEYMKENGSRTNAMVAALKCSRMGTLSMEVTRTGKLTERVSINGRTEKFTTESG